MRTELEQANIFSSINYLLNGDERLLMSFFHHKKPKIKAPKHKLLSDAKKIGPNELILFNIALGFIDNNHPVYLFQILGLDDDCLINFIKALIHLKELNLEVYHA
ncbi:MAG: hypothetical protein GY760_25890 [Deltaproteobacteria bacterium]|nr:hypothetical protein [Deltaproteobacteria bacterium]